MKNSLSPAVQINAGYRTAFNLYTIITKLNNTEPQLEQIGEQQKAEPVKY